MADGTREEDIKLLSGLSIRKALETKEFILTARKKTGEETTYQNLVKGVAKINEWTEITGTLL